MLAYAGKNNRLNDFSVVSIHKSVSKQNFSFHSIHESLFTWKAKTKKSCIYLFTWTIV